MPRRLAAYWISTPVNGRGKPLKDDEFVISADKKTSVQARRRKHPTRACRPRKAMRVEHEYFRCGAWAYIAALDVHHARVFGRCETQNRIAPFDRLVEQVMTRPPYHDARRVFWIVDNCSAHRGAWAVQRLKDQYPQLTLIHAPVHASWLNQVEIYFSIVQRKVLSPNDFPSLDALAERLLDFNTTGNPRPNRSNGSSIARTWPNYSQNWEIRPPYSARRIRDRTYETMY